MLASLLGEKATIIEDGLNGRTSGWDDRDVPGRNGLQTLPDCLDRHAPLGVVIVALGTNDLKVQFAADAAEIHASIQRLLATVREYTRARVVVISPAPIGELDSYRDQFQGAEPKRQELTRLLTADFHPADLCIDAARVVTPGSDGVHWPPESHRRLAEIVRTHLVSLSSIFGTR